MRLVERFKEAVCVAGELQFSLLPIEQEDFACFAKGEGEEGHITEAELIQRAEAHKQRLKARQHLLEFKAADQKAAYERLECQARRQALPVTLAGIWAALSQSAYLAAQGCRVEVFAQGEALLIRGIDALPEEAFLTTSRELYEQGLSEGDLRALHLATYGDPLFEQLLDHLLQAEPAVLEAWQQREPLQGLQDAQGRRYTRLGDLTPVPEVDSAPLIPLPDSSGPPPARPEQSGRLQQLALDAAVAALVKQKLHGRADSPANQLAKLDAFQKDVTSRSAPKVQLRGTAPERAALLAKSQALLWPVQERDHSLFFEGDPLLLKAARQIIERHLHALPQEKRNNINTAQRILERSAARILGQEVELRAHDDIDSAEACGGAGGRLHQGKERDPHS